MNQVRDLVAIYRKYFRSSKRTLVTIWLFTSLTTIVASISPRIFGEIVDNMAQKDIKGLVSTLVIYMSLNILSVFLSNLSQRATKRFIVSAANGIKKNLYGCIVAFNSCTFDKYTEGELIARIDGDADQVTSYFSDFAMNITNTLFSLVFSSAMILTISKRNTMIALLNLPISILINVIVKTKYYSINQKMANFRDRYFAFISESFRNHHNIKSFVLEEEFRERFNKRTDQGIAIKMDEIKLENRVELTKNILGNVLNIAMLYVFGVLIHNGELTIGSMVAFNTYSGLFFSAINSIASLNMAANKIKVSAERLTQIEGEGKESYSDLHDIERIVSMECRDLSFGYEPSTNVLNRFSLRITTPGVYGIVGKNGTGKSTLVKLLMRLYRVPDGRIILNDNDINDISPKSLRSAIGYMSKNAFILNDTIYNNIAVVAPDVSQGTVVSLCKEVGLDDYFSTLENGYNTVLGPTGITLSSGQQQRLCFARMLLLDRSMYLLDECTSDLDGVAEISFMQSIRSLSYKAIVLVITHKPSTIKECDRIFVVEDGGVAEHGTYEELLQQSSRFARMFHC